MPTSQTAQGVDRTLLRTYLNDHLTGATGMLQRLEHMRDSYRDLPIHDEVAQLTQDVREERSRLAEIIETLGLTRSRPKEALARAGEVAGRLKLNGRLFSRSPMSPVLELELLQSGVSGKSGLWRTLGTHAGQLGLDATEFQHLEHQALEQVETLVRCHRALVGPAFRQG
jgi:hypothetical protein